MAKNVRGFNADEDVTVIITEANIAKNEFSKWVNDKIKKGVLYEKNPGQKESKELVNLRVKL